MKDYIEKEIALLSSNRIDPITKGRGFLKLFSETTPQNHSLSGSRQMTIIDQALINYNREAVNNRNKLETLQMIVKGIITTQKLEEKVEQWRENRSHPDKLKSPVDFIQVAILSFDCLKKFPEQMLLDIKHRRPAVIHSHFFDNNYLGSFVETAKDRLSSGLQSFDEDVYLFENLKRVIDSLLSLLKLEPGEVYEELQEAVTIENLPKRFIILATKFGISLNDINNPEQTFAWLPQEKTLPTHQIQFIETNSDKYIIGCSSQTCFYWNPESSKSSTTFYTAEHGSVRNVFSYVKDECVVTLIVTNNRILIFNNFKHIDDFSRPSEIQGLAFSERLDLFFGCHSLYVNAADKVALFKISREGEYESLLSKMEILEFAKTIPLIKEKIAQEIASQCCEENDLAFYPFIEHPILKIINVAGTDLIVLSVQILISGVDDTLVFIYEYNNDNLKMKSSVFLTGLSTVAFDFVVDDSKLYLICGFLDRSQKGKLIQLIEVIEGKTVIRGYSKMFIDSDILSGDILQIEVLDPSHVFSFQETRGNLTGKLHSINPITLNHTYIEIEELNFIKIVK